MFPSDRSLERYRARPATVSISYSCHARVKMTLPLFWFLEMIRSAVLIVRSRVAAFYLMPGHVQRQFTPH